MDVKKDRVKKITAGIVRQAIINQVMVTGGFIVRLAAIPLVVGYNRGRSLNFILNRLEQIGHIEILANNSVKLTQYGAVRALPVIRPILKKDGKIRVLVFDIPETSRKKRDSFRSHIKLLGFKMHQKSVWISNLDCEVWIKELLEFHELDANASLYIGERVF